MYSRKNTFCSSKNRVCLTKIPFYHTKNPVRPAKIQACFTDSSLTYQCPVYPTICPLSSIKRSVCPTKNPVSSTKMPLCFTKSPIFREKKQTNWIGSKKVLILLYKKPNLPNKETTTLQIIKPASQSFDFALQRAQSTLQKNLNFSRKSPQYLYIYLSIYLSVCVCVCDPRFSQSFFITKLLITQTGFDFMGLLFRFYGISTFVGYLMPNLFLYKQPVLFHTIQFSVSSFNIKNSSISSNSF